MTEVDELLRQRDRTVPSGDGIERQALDHARQTVQAAIAAEARTRGTAAPRRRLPRHWPWLTFAGALVAAIGVALIALLPARSPLLSGGTHNDFGILGPAPASAKVLLIRAADQIERQRWHPLQVGEYYYVRTESRTPYENGPTPASTKSARQLHVSDTWIGADGFGRVVQRGDEVLLFHASPQRIAAEHQLQQQGTHLQVLAYSQPYLFVDRDYAQLIRLPTKSAALRRWIERHAIGSGSREDRAALYAGALLQQAAPLPPALTAAFYRVIASLPEMQLVGPTHDPLGRSGVAVRFLGGRDGGYWEMIFNSRTGALLSDRYTQANGRVWSWDAIVTTAIVHGDDQLP